MGDHKVVMEGFLWKKGHVRRNWTKRYFKLGVHQLSYFKDNVQKGEVRFQGTKLVIRSSQEDVIHEKKGKSGSTVHRFEIQLWDAQQIKNIMLSAQTKEEMNQWVVAIYDAANKTMRATLDPPIDDMNRFRKEGNRTTGKEKETDPKSLDPKSPAPRTFSPPKPPPPKVEEKPLRVRAHSDASNVAISALMDYGDLMDGLQADLEEIVKNMEGSTPTMDMVAGYRGRVAQLNGSLAKLQATKIDAVLTGHLVTAQEEARSRRKTLNQRAEAMGDETLKLGATLSDLMATFLGKETTLPPKEDGSSSEVVLVDACTLEDDDDDDDDAFRPTGNEDGGTEVVGGVSQLNIGGDDGAEWVETMDDATGRNYYYNKRTNATQWEPPPGFETPDPSVGIVPPPFAVSHSNGEDDDDDAVASVTATYSPKSETVVDTF